MGSPLIRISSASAWRALSQIFVVSANGFGMDDRTELWLNYYDPRLPRLSLHMPA